MKEPVLDKRLEKLDELLQQLQKKHEEGLNFWNVCLTDTQNCLLIGNSEGVEKHLQWMFNTSSDFRGNILRVIGEFNSVKS